MKDEKKQERSSVLEDFRMLLRVTRLGGELSPWILPVYFLLALIEAVTPFVNIILPALILNELTGVRDPQLLALLAGATVALNCAAQLVRSGLQRLVETYVVEMDRLLGVRISRKTMTLDYEHMEDPQTQNMHQDVLEARSWIPARIESQMKLFSDFLRAAIQLAASLGLVYRLIITPAVGGYSGLIALVDSPLGLIMLFLFFLGVLAFNAKSVTFQAEYWEEYAQNSREPQRRSLYYYYLFDDYRIGKEIRLYGIADMLEADLRDKREWFAAKITELVRKPLPYTAFNVALTAFSSGAVYLFVALKALLGSISVGEALLYIGAMNQFSLALNSLGSHFTTMRSLTPFSKFYFNYLELPVQKQHGSALIKERADHRYEIEFRNVSFRYPGSEQYSLKNVSLKLNIGERLAVVGMNGAGKTTFIKLLCRLYDPSEGEILLDGRDIREYDYHEYLRLFSVVFQDFKLYAYPLGENIAASAEYDEMRVWQALQQADVSEHVQRLPQQLKQYLYRNVSAEGVEISGGEAQKIAIARALYKNAPFVILDEPTAALDPISEFEIYSNLDTLVGQKTAVFISHRLSSCRFCDDILVFHQGEVIQRGNHDDLLKDNSGKYSEMWYAQAQYYAEDKG